MRKFLRIAALIIGLAMVTVAGYHLLTTRADYAAAKDAYQDAADDFLIRAAESTVPVSAGTSIPTDSATEPTVPETTGPPVETAPVSVDFDALLESNSDVVGWIYCPDTPINYPVVQTENNSDYLRRLLDGSYNRSGTIFMDYRCETWLAERNTILYGHNMESTAMFGTLERYKNQSYYDAHPTLYYLTPQGNFRIDLIAGLTLEADSELYIIAPEEDDFADFLEEILEKSTFQTCFDTTGVERVMTLSTCSYTFLNARYIIVGAVTPIGSSEPIA